LPDDKVASELAAIRERAVNELEKWRLTPEPSGGIHMSAHDVPRLLAAIEAVLALAADWDETGAKLHDAAERASDRGALPERTNLMDGRAQAHQDCAASLRDCVSRSLLGEDKPDA
jgi:hypothetical protein